MKKYKSVILITISIIVIAALFLAVLILAKRKTSEVKAGSTVSDENKTDTTKTKLVKSGLSTILSSATGSDIDVQKYIDERVEDEDAAFINEMLDEKVNVNTVTMLAEDYIKEGTITKDSVRELLSDMTPEEKQRFYELAEKYGEDFSDYIGK